MALGPAKDGWEVDPEGVYTVTGDVSAAAATLFDGWAKEGAMEAAGTFLKGAVTLPGGAFMGIGELSRLFTDEGVGGVRRVGPGRGRGLR